jgi:hypothetical protein
MNSISIQSVTGPGRHLQGVGNEENSSGFGMVVFSFLLARGMSELVSADEGPSGVAWLLNSRANYFLGSREIAGG